MLLSKSFILAGLIVPLCVAEEISIHLEDGTILPAVTFENKDLPDSALSMHGVTIGKSKLSDVKEALSGGRPYEGQGTTTYSLLCYRGYDGTIVAFELNMSFMAFEKVPDERVVTSIAVFAPQSHYPLDDKCAQSGKIDSSNQIGGIRLGMTKAEIAKIMGRPSVEREDWVLYNYRSALQTPRKMDLGHSIVSIVKIRFSNNVASQISISRITPYDPDFKEAGPFESDDDGMLYGTFFNKTLPDAYLTTLGISVNKSTLSDVSKKLQGRPIYREGDAGGSLAMLCYRGADGTVVAFESGELGGSDEDVLEISLFAAKTRYRLNDKCAKSEKISKNVGIGNLYLGMTKNEVKKILGKPSNELGNLALYYIYYSKVYLYNTYIFPRETVIFPRETVQGPWDLSSWIEVRFTDKKASKISISQTMTN